MVSDDLAEADMVGIGLLWKSGFQRKVFVKTLLEVHEDQLAKDLHWLLHNQLCVMWDTNRGSVLVVFMNLLRRGDMSIVSDHLELSGNWIEDKAMRLLVGMLQG